MVLTVDIAVFARADGGWRLLLVRRGRPPFRGAWALPGGKVRDDESAECAARRELLEETGLAVPSSALRQMSTYSAPDRDPRGRVVTILYHCMVPGESCIRAGSDAADVQWQSWGQESSRSLAFDHEVLLARAEQMGPAAADTAWRIRRANRSDTRQLIELHRAALRQVGADAGAGPWDDDLNDVEWNYPAATSDFIVAEFGTYIVGMGALRALGAGVGEIKRMRVAPHWQGQGLGRALLERLESAARDRGLAVLRLDTTPTQTRALSLYKAAGYDVVGETIAANLPSLLLEKRLKTAHLEIIEPEIRGH